MTTFRIPPEAARVLAALGQPEGGTSVVAALAAFVALLTRVHATPAVSLAIYPFRQRSPGCEDLGAAIAHPTPVLIEVPGNPPFSEFVQQVRVTALDALLREPSPVEGPVDARRSHNASPLAPPVFGFESWAVVPMGCEHAGLQRVPEQTGPLVRPEDLTLILEEMPEGLIGRLIYNTERLDEETVERLAAQLLTLLDGVAADPDQSLSALPLMSLAERRQILVGWNDTAAPYSHEHCLHELFEAQVERSPDAPAVSFGDQHLTYARLNRRANQLAHALIRTGVGPNVPVGIFVGPSPDMIVSLMAVLKAGGVQVPLDPAYPAARIAFKLADTQTAVLVTHRTLLDRLPEYSGQTICLDTEEPSLARECAENPSRRAAPDDPACILYTSGSQGRPKGALLPHRSLVNYTEAAARQFELGPADRVLQFASISFDASAEEIYPCLSRGGTLVLSADWMMASTGVFLKMCRDQAITVLDLPTAYWHTLILSSGDEPLALPSSLRLVIIGGEKALPARLAAWHRKTSGRVRLINTYGPTEATIVTAWCDLTQTDPATCGARELPIGRPVPNTRVYLLDRFMQPVPIGVPGELYIGGVGLAQGYLNQPELTAERFVLVDSSWLMVDGSDKDSFGPSSIKSTRCAGTRPSTMQRLYRTGDLARYRLDGQLEFVGRQDDQVKIRGYRIETGEVEAALLQHAGVRDCVVVAKENAPGEKHLAAYYVSAGRDGPAPGDLREYLRGRLPEYMHPATFRQLEALPLTPNGKVDRRSLLSTDEPPARPGTGVIGPRTAVERELAEIWEELFGHRPIGVRDNFFDLGGHSLLAVRLFDQIERRWNRTLPLGSLFQSPTIEELAALLAQETPARGSSSLVPIQPHGKRVPLFCVHGIGGNILNYYRLPAHLGGDQPLYGLQAMGLSSTPDDSVTIEAMASHYLAEIQQVQPRGPYAIAGFSFGGVVAFEMAQQLRLQGETVGLLVLFDNWAPLSPPRWDWLRRMAGHIRLLRQLGVGRGLAFLRDRTRAVLQRAVSGALWSEQMALSRHRQGSLPFHLEHLEQAHIRALDEYEPQFYPGRVTLFRAQTRSIEGQADPEMGWGALAIGGVEVIEVPGDHNSMLDDDHVPVLACRLSDCLARAFTDP